MENKIYYLAIPIEERMPPIANENYLTISEKGFETPRFFNGERFEMAYYEGKITHWLEKHESILSPSQLLERVQELEKVVKGIAMDFEGDGMENMGIRENNIYDNCIKALKNQIA